MEMSEKCCDFGNVFPHFRAYVGRDIIVEEMKLRKYMCCTCPRNEIEKEHGCVCLRQSKARARSHSGTNEFE